MADDKARPQAPKNRAWRGASAAAPRPGGGGAAARPKSGKGKKVFLVLVAMAALVGALVAWWLFIYQGPEPYLLTISVTENQKGQFPPNAFALRDAQALADRFKDHKLALESQEGKGLERELGALQGRAGGPVVVHLSANALARGGEVYLLPADAQVDDRGKWVPLGRVLALVEACPAADKLLILDVMRPVAGARLGALYDDTAAAVQAELERRQKEDKLPFWVLCACSGGQESHVSEALGRSAFAYYLDEGLCGHADGYGAKADGKVTVKELAEFTAARVGRWAVENRGARQTPALYGQAKDFVVALAPNEPRQPARADKVERYPGWLQEQWQKRDDWLKDKAYRHSPQAFRRLEATLLAAEQSWRAGIDPTHVRDQLDRLVNDIADMLPKKPLRERPAAAASLALAQAADLAWKPDAETAAKLDGALKDLAKLDKEKDNVRKEVWEKFRDRDQDLALLVWHAVLGLRPQDGDWQAYRARFKFLVGLLPPALDPPPAEVLFLKRLDLAGRSGPVWVGPMHRSLQVTDAAEKALAGDPRALYGLRSLLRAADDKRREGEGHLLHPDTVDEAADADKLLREAADLYRDLRERAAPDLAGAFLARDEALARLPGLADYLAACPVFDSADDAGWQEAVQLLADLRDRLDRFAAAAALTADEAKNLLPDVKQKAARLTKLLGDLGARLEQRAAQDGVAGLLAIEAALQSPRPAAPRRAALWQRAGELAQQLLEATLKEDQADNAGPTRTQPPAGSSGVVAQADRARRRARLALDQLRLAGLPAADALERDLARATGERDAKAWHGLGDQVRAALAQMPASFRDEQDLRKAERLGWFLPGLDPADRRTPGRQLRQAELEEFWKWAGTRYQEEVKTLQGKEAALARAYEAWAGKYQNFGGPPQ